MDFFQCLLGTQEMGDRESLMNIHFKHRDNISRSSCGEGSGYYLNSSITRRSVSSKSYQGIGRFSRGNSCVYFCSLSLIKMWCSSDRNSVDQGWRRENT